MQAWLAKVFGANWTTNIPATGFAICSSAELMELIPVQYEKFSMSFCAFAIAMGLFAAKSSNVSNARNPLPEAHPVFAPTVIEPPKVP